MDVEAGIVDVCTVLFVDVKTVGDDVMIDDPFTDDKLVGIEWMNDVVDGIKEVGLGPVTEAVNDMFKGKRKKKEENDASV